MQYVREFREQWRSWIGASLGLSVGMGAYSYSMSLFVPHMIAEFGWSKAAFALHGTLALSVFLVIPLIGRLTDLFGARRIALIGVLLLPLFYIAFSLQTGSIALFFILTVLKMLVGTTTASLVYCRVVVLNFTLARGLALAICASAPALLMSLCAPLLGALIASYGWRTGYLALALGTLLLGLLAVLVIPPDRPRAGAGSSGGPPVRSKHMAKQGTGKDYRLIFRSRTFWVIFAGMFLCNSPNTLMSSQFSLLFMDQGVGLALIPWLLSLYATSVVIGRFTCGLALDRLPAYSVAATSLAMPAIGFFLLSAELQLITVIVVSVVLIGLAQGAEGDLAAYIVAHYFPTSLYGSVAGLVHAGLSLSSALGAILLSVLLHGTESYQSFLYLMGFATLLGASLFIALRSRAPVPGVKQEDSAELHQPVTS